MRSSGVYIYIGTVRARAISARCDGEIDTRAAGHSRVLIII